ncbi:hypothetical protein PC128_g21981 [Phytophthora cactorum]|nr:hypothetical protein PC128_g21981 [Phytophthora cactorum]
MRISALKCLLSTILSRMAVRGWIPDEETGEATPTLARKSQQVAEGCSTNA